MRPPRIAVVDLEYKDPAKYGLAATWLRWELWRAGQEPVPPAEAEVACVTITSPELIPKVRTWAKRNCPAGTRLALGGIYAPAAVDCADVVCVGEGARFMRTLLSDGWEAACALPDAWVPGESRPVVPSAEFPWDLPPLNDADGTVRVFGARGCRHRCLFCATAWSQPYRCNPDLPRLQAQMTAMLGQNRRVAVVSNDGGDPALRHLEGQQAFFSARFDSIKSIMPITRAQTKMVRIGVEGVSERLREAIRKPVSTDELPEVIGGLGRERVQCRLFYVIGLPGETAADWEELREFFRRVRHLHRQTITVNLHTFLPHPMTPLGVLPLEDSYAPNLEAFKRWWKGGEGWCKVLSPVFGAGPDSRIKRSRYNMGASDAAMRRGFWCEDNPNWRVQYPATPARLRRVAARYCERMGLPHPQIAE